MTEQHYNRLLAYAEVATRHGNPPVNMSVPTMDLMLGMQWVKQRLRDSEEGHEITAGICRAATRKLLKVQAIAASDAMDGHAEDLIREALDG